MTAPTAARIDSALLAARRRIERLSPCRAAAEQRAGALLIDIDTATATIRVREH